MSYISYRNAQWVFISSVLSVKLSTKTIMHYAYRDAEGLTRYSKTSVRLLSVWTMSCSVTMLACLRSFSNDTTEAMTDRYLHKEMKPSVTLKSNGQTLSKAS